MQTLEVAEVSRILNAGFGAEATVRARRPGALFQVNLPAYLSDGDAVAVYLRPSADGRLTMTDLGQTCMRLSYSRKLTDATLMTIADLAQRHGFSLEEHRISALVHAEDMLGAALGMIQIQSEAEAVINRTVARGRQSDNFRSIVRAILGEEFKDKVEFDFHEPGDKDGLYSIDAMIQWPGTSIGVAIAPSTVDAERAVAAKMHLAATLPSGRRRWIAIPKDVSALDRKTQLRLMKEYLVPVPKFEDERDKIGSKILDLASCLQIGASSPPMPKRSSCSIHRGFAGGATHDKRSICPAGPDDTGTVTYSRGATGGGIGPGDGAAGLDVPPTTRRKPRPPGSSRDVVTVLAPWRAFSATARASPRTKRRPRATRSSPPPKAWSCPRSARFSRR